jgi:hypothetical protein
VAGSVDSNPPPVGRPLRWPDGELIEAITAGVTGLGAAASRREKT